MGVECCKANAPQQGSPVLLYHCPCAVHGNAHSCDVLFQQMQRLHLSQSGFSQSELLPFAAADQDRTLRGSALQICFSLTMLVHTSWRFWAASGRRRLAPRPAALLALLGGLGRAAAAVAGLLDLLRLPDEGLLLALAARTRQDGGCCAAPVLAAVSPSQILLVGASIASTPQREMYWPSFTWAVVVGQWCAACEARAVWHTCWRAARSGHRWIRGPGPGRHLAWLHRCRPAACFAAAP